VFCCCFLVGLSVCFLCSYNPRIDVDDEESCSNNETQASTSSQRRDDDMYMSAVRDMIAGELINRLR